MDYVVAWEKMRADSSKIAWRRENPLIHTFNNPYGYKININHPLAIEKWKSFCEKWHNGEISSEKPWDYTKRRLEFERQFMASKYYLKCIEIEKQKYGDAYKYIKMHGCYPDDSQVLGG